MIDLRLPRRSIFVFLIGLGLIVSFFLNTNFLAQAETSANKDPVIMAAGDIACDPQSANFNDGKGKNGIVR